MTEMEYYETCIKLARRVHKNQKRRGRFYDSRLETHTDIQKPYSTHVEGVTEIVLYFANKLDFRGVSLKVLFTASIFHDTFEDGELEDISKVIDYLKMWLSHEELVQVVRIILALSKPSSHTEDRLYNLLGKKGLGEEVIGRDSLEIAKFSEIRSYYIIDSVMQKFALLKDKWSADEPATSLGYRFSGVSNNETIYINHLGRLFENSGINQGWQNQLYAFVENYLFVSLRGMRNQKDFRIDRARARIQNDLSAILQIMVFTKFSKTHPELGDIKYAIVLIKLCDQMYNAWDNYFLLDEKDLEKLQKYVTTTKLLAIRAAFYEQILMANLGQDNALFKVFRDVRNNLMNVLVHSEARLISSESSLSS